MTSFIAGWLPAIILPTATYIQLHKIIQTKHVAGVSQSAWLLYAIANIGAYIFTDKLLAPQAILAFLLTAILNLIIAVLVHKYKTQ
jgi:uncharacterized protein with PQ loop repeat